MNSDNIHLIDLNAILKEKNISIPRIFVRIIAKIIKQDSLNEFIRKFGKYKGKDFCSHVLEELNVKTSISGIDNIPSEGKFIFVSNHPLGALEALTIAKYLGERFDGNINFITNEILTYISPLKSIFTPVVVGKNRQSKSNIEQIEQLFRSEKQIIMFPSGVVSRRIKGKIQDPEWKKMFVSKSKQHKRNIIPIHCSGNCSDTFLNISNIRKKLGIKYNIELLLLPSEIFKYRNKSIDVIIGKPLDYSCAYSYVSDLEYAQKVRDIVYKLPF